jgi:plasmid rolling circle replication initiator protein Rep
MPDVQALQDLHESYLSVISPDDEKFDQHKSVSQKTSDLFELDTKDGLQGFIYGKRFIFFGDYAAKIDRCGRWLIFVKGQEKWKLVDARFCKTPMCPMCNWRRAAKWKSKLLDLLPTIQEEWNNPPWLFLTLTKKNCELDILDKEISHLNEAFNRLSKNVRFPFVGLVKSVEVTRSWDIYDNFTGKFIKRSGSKFIYDYQKKNKNVVLRMEPTTEVHPHLHIVGIVKPSYFTRNYIRQDEWVSMWQQALRVEYQPGAHIRRVKCKKGVNPSDFDIDNCGDDDGVRKAIFESLKYTIKEQDLIGRYCKDDEINSRWLKTITEKMYMKRRVEYRGAFKKLAKELEVSEDDDLIKIGQEDETIEKTNLPIATFTWNKLINRYVKIWHEEDEEDSPSSDTELLSEDIMKEVPY